MKRGEVRWAEHPDTISEGYIGELITTLRPERLSEVCEALDRATGC